MVCTISDADAAKGIKLYVYCLLLDSQLVELCEAAYNGMKELTLIDGSGERRCLHFNCGVYYQSSKSSML